MNISKELLTKLMTRLYASAYHDGHNDTVESRYTDVLPCDADTYHEDVVSEWMDEQGELDFAEPGTTNDDKPFEPGEIIEWDGDLYEVLRNLGEAGEVTDFPCREGFVEIHWTFKGEKCRRAKV